MEAKNRPLPEGTLTETPNLLLASNSPRRRQLLSLGDWHFEVRPADVDETPFPNESPPAYVLRLAEAKARAAGAGARPGQLVIAADTTVADGDQILGKPADAAEAEAMLTSLRGRTHQVYTAVAVYQPESSRLETDLASTDVPMREYSEAEIRAYVASGDPFDKAGSYAIQHAGFRPVEKLSGCYANVVGLPLCHLERTLVKFGLARPNGLADACQRALSYDCDVHMRVREGDL